MSEIDLISPQARAKATAESPLYREATITIRLKAPTPGRIGPVLDEFTALVTEAIMAMATEDITVEMDVPEYHQVFYGWEADCDDPPA